MNTTTDVRERIIPPGVSQNDTDEYKNVLIDPSSIEYNEPLVDLELDGIRTDAFYGRTDGLNQPIGRAFDSGLFNVYARESVARKLQQVNVLLRPYGMRVVVLDGFRPIAVQQDLWTWMLEQARLLFPHADEAACEAFALRYATNPSTFRVDDPTTWPTHATGGAVDLSLEEIETGKPAFMGGIYLDSSKVSGTRFFEEEGLTDSASHREALRNRRLLYWCMTEVGFVNYAFEWWHFDYLTQASIMNRGMPQGAKAHYGLANEGRSPE